MKTTSLNDRVAQVVKDVILSVFPTMNQEQGLIFVWDALQKLGIEKDNVSSHGLITDGFCKEGDARVIFCEQEDSLPVPWFRKLWSILVLGEGILPSPTSEISVLKDFVNQNRPIAQWSDKELVAAYHIDCPANVQDELQLRAKNQAVIAFADEAAGIVNESLTLEVLRTSRRREIPKTYQAEGKAYRLWAIGEFPGLKEELSPLSPDTLLLNGYCSECEMDFKNVDIEARQFLAIIFEEDKAPALTDRIAVLGLVTLAKQGVVELRKAFPQVGILFDEQKSLGQLPNLVGLVNSCKENSTQDPFGNKRY